MQPEVGMGTRAMIAALAASACLAACGGGETSLAGGDDGSAGADVDGDAAGDPGADVLRDRGDGAETPGGPDTDGDTILDRDEWDGDRDLDAVPNYQDIDSDGDTRLDADEAGDRDPATPPRDSDGDGWPDFLDWDSDNDGLSDFQETEASTDPASPDTDGDGFPDLAEWAIPGGDPLDAGTGLPDDVCFAVLRDGEESRCMLTFDVSRRAAEVFFLVDTTAGMAAAAIGDEAVRALPLIRAREPDATFGVGSFQDFPVAPYGEPGDAPFRLHEAITSDEGRVAAAIRRLRDEVSGGGDRPESATEALFQTATGEGLGEWVPPSGAAGCFGAACFHAGALPIVVLATDAPFHNGPPSGGVEPYEGIVPEPHAWPEALAALLELDARVVGVSCAAAGSWDVLEDLRNAARDTSAVDTEAAPFVFDRCAGGLGEWLAGAVEHLVTAPTDVATYAEDDATDALGVDARCFVRRVAPRSWWGPTGVERDPGAVLGMDDAAFYGVREETILQFEGGLANDGCFAGDWYARPFLGRIVATRVNSRTTGRVGERLLVIAVPAVEPP